MVRIVHGTNNKRGYEQSTVRTVQGTNSPSIVRIVQGTNSPRYEKSRYQHVKYAGIASIHTCVPVAVESMGRLGYEASEFLTDLGRRLSVITDDARVTSHIFQRVSVLIH